MWSIVGETGRVRIREGRGRRCGGEEATGRGGEGQENEEGRRIRNRITDVIGGTIADYVINFAMTQMAKTKYTLSQI